MGRAPQRLPYWRPLDYLERPDWDQDNLQVFLKNAVVHVNEGNMAEKSPAYTAVRVIL